jgi:hypothetical protein
MASYRLRALVMVAVLLSFLPVDQAYGQGSGKTSTQEYEASNSVPTNTSEPEGDDTSDGGAGAIKAKYFLSDFEFWLSFEILLFGLGVIVVEFMLLRHAKLTAEEALRVYAVTLIIVGTLFAITAGFDSTQIAPAMGLFGTIAGYLLGKRTSDPPKYDQGEKKS